MITYDLPLDMYFGSHQVGVVFLGGFTWADPMGQGDSLNPEFYLPSSNSIGFNVTQTSQVIITSSPGEVDRSDLVLIQGLLTDGVGRGLADRGIEVSVGGQFMTGLEVGGNGSFSVYMPVPPDMPLGHRIVEIEFAGEEFVLSSNSSTVITVFGPVFISIVDPPLAAVDDTIILRGTAKDNLEEGWLGNHTIEIFLDGILIGITSTGDNGHWSFPWVIPDSLDIGNHTLSVIAPAQGYHRQGNVEATLTISYHTVISAQTEELSATRGSEWNFSGRLYEGDTGYELGLDDREVSVLLDGIVVGTVFTELGGLFNYSHSLGYAISRGSHNISFSYGGEFLYLPTEANLTVFALSDVLIEVQPITSKIIRGNISHSILIQGFVREIGGDSSIFENLTISLSWGESALPLQTGPWDNPNTMNFQMKAKAQELMPPGKNIVTIKIGPDQSRFLNGASKDIEITVVIEVDFTLSSIELSTGQRVIRGIVNVTARDTGSPVEGLSMIAMLQNGTTSHFSMSRLTDADPGPSP